MITKNVMFLMRRSMREASRLKLQFLSEHLYFSRIFGTPLLIHPYLSRDPDNGTKLCV